MSPVAQVPLHVLQGPALEGVHSILDTHPLLRGRRAP